MQLHSILGQRATIQPNSRYEIIEQIDDIHRSYSIDFHSSWNWNSTSI